MDYRLLKIALIVCVMAAFNTLAFAETQDKITHVVIISFDGLRPDAISQLGPALAPNFHEMINNGASTLNARTDPDWTVTMPNHTCMITGRGVLGKEGHGYVDNRSTELSIHDNKASYVASIFDVVKDHGLTTGFFASKKKFQVFLNSYGGDGKHGHASKIDIHFLTDHDDQTTLKYFLKQMGADLPALTFVHFAGPDTAGHHHGWSLTPGSSYLLAVEQEDVYLGKILREIGKLPALAQSTVVIATSDHGGLGSNHEDNTKVEDYRIPFIIWGKGVAGGIDLYKMNKDIRQDPGDKQIPYGQLLQPIRNGDVANCAMSILGLPMVPGSTIGNPDAICGAIKS
jgi:predicted AlkP superfamily pyrophosphatase or phosphodiesterase